jgi:hypothetical protein
MGNESTKLGDGSGCAQSERGGGGGGGGEMEVALEWRKGTTG